LNCWTASRAVRPAYVSSWARTKRVEVPPVAVAAAVSLSSPPPDEEQAETTGPRARARTSDTQRRLNMEGLHSRCDFQLGTVYRIWDVLLSSTRSVRLHPELVESRVEKLIEFPQDAPALFWGRPSTGASTLLSGNRAKARLAAGTCEEVQASGLRLPARSHPL
jgi:hypothetical protein